MSSLTHAQICRTQAFHRKSLIYWRGISRSTFTKWRGWTSDCSLVLRNSSARQEIGGFNALLLPNIITLFGLFRAHTSQQLICRIAFGNIPTLERARICRNLPSRRFTRKDRSQVHNEYLLEYAFAAHALAEKSEDYAFVHKIADGLDFYKIILNQGKAEGRSGLFSINYVYDHKSGDYSGIKIELLPKGWNILSHPKMSNLIMLDVNDRGIVVVFDVNNPMNIFVIFLPNQ